MKKTAELRLSFSSLPDLDHKSALECQREPVMAFMGARQATCAALDSRAESDFLNPGTEIIHTGGNGIFACPSFQLFLSSLFHAFLLSSLLCSVGGPCEPHNQRHSQWIRVHCCRLDQTTLLSLHQRLAKQLDHVRFENLLFVADALSSSARCLRVISSPLDVGGINLLPNLWYSSSVSLLIQGSANGCAWTSLDQKDDAITLSPFRSSVFFLNPPQSIFRFFRIRQTGRNSDNDDVLSLSAFDVYGTLYNYSSDAVRAAQVKYQDVLRSNGTVILHSLTNSTILVTPFPCRFDLY